MRREKRSVPFLNIGSSSLLMVFLVLCLVVFAVLTLTGAQGDYRFSQRLGERRTRYYTACNRAEETIAGLWETGVLPELTEPYSFQIPVDDRQALRVVLEPDEEDGYAVTVWQTVSTEEWIPEHS